MIEITLLVTAVANLATALILLYKEIKHKR